MRIGVTAVLAFSIVCVSLPARAADKTFYVTAVRAELRKGPSYYYPVVVRLDRNAKVTSSKRVGQWFQVKDEEANEGWVTGWLLGDKPVEENGKTTPPEMEFGGSEAGEAEEESAVAPEGEPTESAAVEAEAESEPGAETIEVQPEEIAPEPEKPETGSPSKIRALVPNKPKIALRRMASDKSKLFMMVPKGTRLTVVGQAGPWFRVKTPKGNVGWVSGYDVDIAK